MLHTVLNFEVDHACLHAGEAGGNVGEKVEVEKELRIKQQSATITCNTGTAFTITRNSSGDEIANVNFLCDDSVHMHNTSINAATYRRGYVFERRFTKFREITQCNGHYAVQGHSRSPIVVPIESSYTTSY